ncbi:MAG: hypothetical protein GF315_02430 [candidate division Zixibacteria bacterium]|nr:hypothetical protein [candidate division Zixibacteria bacterium]
MKVHIHQEYDREFIENLKSQLKQGVEITVGKTIPQPPLYEILVCGVPEREVIEASPKLKHLVIPWAGLPQKTRKLMRNYPSISIHNIHHNAIPTAEMAISMMLVLSKDLIPIDSNLRKNDWTKRYEEPSMILLSGKHALILGYGAIGKEISRRCLALDLKVSAIKRTVESNMDNNIRLYPIAELDELLPTADILFVSIPLTTETEGLLDAEKLSLLPDNAILVNISRGKIIDEKSLFEALKSKRIKAGLDVWYNYPDDEETRKDTPPSEYPFYELSNVIMTPHLAGHSDKTEVLRAKSVAELLNAKMEGEDIPNRIDLKRGY